MFDEIAINSLLYDFYGMLLSKRQQEVLGLYYEENLSLGEIADEFGISRQAVHDALKNGHKALEQYESKLGLVNRLMKQRDLVYEARQLLEDVLIKENEGSSKEIVEELKKIEEILNKMNF